MKVVFQYSREKDIHCLLTKGKASNNSPKPTKVYEQLVASKGENPSSEATNSFIEEFLKIDDVSIDEWVNIYQERWNVIADEYRKRAEMIFGTTLSHDISAFLTINNRRPYDIAGNYFYVSFPDKPSNPTAMHELWHFYTWYGLGEDEEARVGKEKYNELKEALTVLLNLECRDLLGDGVEDVGYPQHQEVRNEMIAFWEKKKDIPALWRHFVDR